MTVSEKLEDGEDRVFASAAPVSETDLAEEPTTPLKETETASKEEGPKAPRGGKARQGEGRPSWHLSLALGLVIALAGGVLLWLQSPVLALLVGGGLVVLVGLALALWHLFGSGAMARRGNASRATGSAKGASGSAGSKGANGTPGVKGGANGTSRQPAGGTGANRRGTKEDGAGGTRNRRRATDGTRDTDPGATRRRRATDRGATGTDPRGTRDRQRHPRGTQPPPPGGGRQNQQGGGRQNPPGGGRGRQPIAGNDRERDPRSRKRRQRRRRDGFLEERTCVNGGRNLIKTPKVEDVKADEGKKLIKLKPLTWRSRRGKLPVEKAPKPPKPPRVKPPRKPKRHIEERVEWPNVDQDHYEPVVAGRLPRITHAKRPVKLPPIYHRDRAGEPAWPTDDQDQRGPSIPPQRDRRGTVATPDQMTRADWENHCNDQAALAAKAAQAKDELATRALAEAQGVEGMDDPEMRQAHENHLRAAARAAHDAEVRRSKASIYTLLGQNPT